MEERGDGVVGCGIGADDDNEWEEEEEERWESRQGGSGHHRTGERDTQRSSYTEDSADNVNVADEDRNSCEMDA